MKRWLSLLDRRWLKVIVILFPVLISIWVIWWNWAQLDVAENWPRYIKLLVQTLLIYPLALFPQAYAWFLILKATGYAVDLSEESRIYFYTYLMKRLPGSIWYVGGRAALYEVRGDASRVAVVGSAIEIILLTLAALINGGAAYASLRAGTGAGWAVGFGAFMLLVLLARQIGRSLFPSLLRLVLPSHTYQPSSVNFTALMMALWLYVGAYHVGASIVIHVVRTLGGETSYAQALLSWAIAGGAGMLISLLIPTGGGARDVSLWALLSAALPPNQALLAVILLRILLLLGDIVWSLVGWGGVTLLAK